MHSKIQEGSLLILLDKLSAGQKQKSKQQTRLVSELVTPIVLDHRLHIKLGALPIPML